MKKYCVEVLSGILKKHIYINKWKVKLVGYLHYHSHVSLSATAPAAKNDQQVCKKQKQCTCKLHALTEKIATRMHFIIKTKNCVVLQGFPALREALTLHV